jgi:hypothetical protein
MSPGGVRATYSPQARASPARQVLRSSRETVSTRYDARAKTHG